MDDKSLEFNTLDVAVVLPRWSVEYLPHQSTFRVIEIRVRAMTTPGFVLGVLICSSAHHPISGAWHESQPMVWHASLLEQQLVVVYFGRGFVYAVYPISVCAGWASDDNGTVNSRTPDARRNIDCVYLFPLLRGFWLATIHTLIGQQILWVDVVSMKSYKLPVPKIFTFLDQ